MLTHAVTGVRGMRVHEIISAEPGAQSLGPERPEPLGGTSMGGEVCMWIRSHFSVSCLGSQRRERLLWRGMEASRGLGGEDTGREGGEGGGRQKCSSAPETCISET